MFCIYCGKQIEDGKTMCDSCAAARNMPYDPAEEPVYQQPAEPVPQQPAQPEAPAFTVSNPVEPPKSGKKPKSPKRFPLGAVIAAVAVVGVAASVAIFWDSITGMFVRNFAKPEDYLSHVEEKEAEKQIGTLTDAYGSILGALGNFTGTDVSDKVEDKVENADNVSTQTQIQVEVGDEILEMLEPMLENSGVNMDLAWLNDIRLTLAGNTDGDLTQADMGIGLGKTTIATLSVLMDLAGGDMYMGIPELSDTYLHLVLEDYMDGAQMPDMDEVQDILDEVVALLPAEEKLNEVLNRCYTLILENVGEVEKTSDTIEVDGLEQKLTVLECTVTEEDILNIAVAILEDVEDDKELMESIYGIAEYAYGYDEDEVDEGIAYALEELDAMAEEADEDNCINLTTYIDNNDVIVGRVIEIDSADGESIEISYVTVWQKDEFAFEADIADAIEITGSGSSKKDILEGEYEIEVEGQHIATLEISDYDEKAAEQGYINGTFTLTPSKDLMEMIIDQSGDMSQISSFLNIAKLSFQVEVASSEKTSQFSMRLQAGGATLFGLTLSSEQGKASDIKVPDSIEVDDQEALQEWILDMDFDVLVENMEDAGVPDEILDVVNQVLDQLDSYR